MRIAELSVEFACAISSDGCLFFKAIDLCKIAGRRYRAGDFPLTAKDVVHRQLPLPKALAKTRICDERVAAEILGPGAFEEIFRNSTVGFVRDIVPTFDPKKAESVMLIESDTTFEQFLERFTADCLTFYDRLLESDTRMDFEVPSCGFYGFADGPRTVRLVSENQNGMKNVFVYKRIA